MTLLELPVQLVGDGALVPCADGRERPYLSCDAAASTSAFPSVLEAVTQFLPWYSSVHRGAGYKSQLATARYEQAREAALGFAGRGSSDDVAIICRNTTEAINHLAYRLRLSRDDVVVSTVVEHHANMLPWARAARCRFIECGTDGTFEPADVERALATGPLPRLLTVTGASNITGWAPPLAEIIEAAHRRGVPVLVDAAQLAPHRPLPTGADFVVWSGHKMYAPFGAGVLVGPRRAFVEGEPFLVGGGAVDMVSLEEVVWTAPPDREEAGSPNVVGAVALGAAIAQIGSIGWPAVMAHDTQLASALHHGLSGIPGVRLLGPGPRVTGLPVATFTVEGVPHALVAARLAAEEGIGVRHGCFCAHPYLMRLLGLTPDEVKVHRAEVKAGRRAELPGAVRASFGINAKGADIERLCTALARVATPGPPPVPYERDEVTGDYAPLPGTVPEVFTQQRRHGSSCSAG